MSDSVTKHNDELCYMKRKIWLKTEHYQKLAKIEKNPAETVKKLQKAQQNFLLEFVNKL
ncbi:PxORF17 peptide [Plutella xylostella granulovirus]|uniref:ORF17 protein n=1 Tax=Plutella xylostella granulovirus TaxID=98383 RepID=Q9DW13_9BBAC|nr:PxORF17 peptide [Plutella xylostella granulovirus]AAG27315.1 PxORF17 peptide [Plutella xylostella granulovirus]AMQ35629.1 PxGV-Corf17 protein [Plutella xylostella granulovirus]AMQ35746.1 PxGV-Korf17 protein [Plutella xylostella granulovirus]AMQ35863.1 PxGV-Morf17 protein [Plutella xylostella granulovirus]AMQ35980.1 PxGV-Torf17 protein [Plutella xylostella granulovirus]